MTLTIYFVYDGWKQIMCIDKINNIKLPNLHYACPGTNIK